MKMKQLLFGAAYYDEYLPYDRMEKDMEMMKKAGMNVIRIAESTWSTWEPQEGVFDFTHLHRMLSCSLKHDIQVIVGTPTYAIPTWLARKCPDIITQTHAGPGRYGHRQNMDIAHPVYLKHAEIIIRKLMEEVSSYDHVIGFQLDNETKSYDTCSSYAQEKFIAYVRDLMMIWKHSTRPGDWITGATASMPGRISRMCGALSTAVWALNTRNSRENW